MADRLDTDYDQGRVKALIANDGWAPETASRLE